MKLLLAGDLHIGRSCGRLKETAWHEEGRAAHAWLRIVDLAIAESIDLICLSGDVVDQDNKFWEAIGPLEKGINRLAEKGIRTIAVAGNHDHDVLGRLADQIAPEQFKLLGRGGTWERVSIEGEDRTALHIDGWSFPRQRVHESPLTDYDLPDDPDTPILGLVHGDLGVVGSPYAPLELARLQALPPAAWLLGHIHAPCIVPGERSWILYPGSPQALDPGETGPHGPWLAHINAAGIGQPEQRPLSSIWHDWCEIDLSDIRDEREIEGALIEKIREKTGNIVEQASQHLRHISLRLRLVGNTPVSHRVGAVVASLAADLCLSIDSVSAGVEGVEVETLPAIDLVEYSKTHSAPGAVARLLLELEEAQVSEETADLIRQAQCELDAVERHRDFAQLERRQITEQTAREYLRTEARALLTQLVSQTI